MIIEINHMGTESRNCTCGTYFSLSFEQFRHSDHIGTRYSAKELLRMENAAKATETMILIGRMFKRKVIVSIFLPVAVRFLRLGFCVSGYLPRRIRRIRKDK